MSILSCITLDSVINNTLYCAIDVLDGDLNSNNCKLFKNLYNNPILNGQNYFIYVKS